MAQKRKSLPVSLVIVLILVTSLLIGLAVQLIWDEVDRKRYPRPNEEKYVLENGQTATIRDMVETYAAEYGVPEYLVYSVIWAESGFQVNAVSSKGAIGLMQLTPDTFTWLLTKTKESLSAETIYSPHINVKYGTFYLSYLYIQFEDWDLVLAAYNAGPGNVSSWLENEAYADGKGGLKTIPFPETRTYLSRVNNAMSVYRRLYYTE